MSCLRRTMKAISKAETQHVCWIDPDPEYWVPIEISRPRAFPSVQGEDRRLPYAESPPAQVQVVEDKYPSAAMMTV
ncbi:MAG: hypothetical protein R3C05_11500 [Pirellulaceae bacterium]